MSFFKRLFGIKDPATAEEEQPAVFAEEAPVEAVPVAETVVEEPLDHFAVITTPAPPVFEEEPLSEPQPTVESPAIVVEDEPVVETASRPSPTRRSRWAA